jgi:hypothetical protein
MVARELQRAEILDGRVVADEIKREVAAEVRGLKMSAEFRHASPRSW